MAKRVKYIAKKDIQTALNEFIAYTGIPVQMSLPYMIRAVNSFCFSPRFKVYAKAHGSGNEFRLYKDDLKELLNILSLKVKQLESSSNKRRSLAYLPNGIALFSDLLLVAFEIKYGNRSIRGIK